MSDSVDSIRRNLSSARKLYQSVELRLELAERHLEIIEDIVVHAEEVGSVSNTHEQVVSSIAGLPGLGAPGTTSLINDAEEVQEKVMALLQQSDKDLGTAVLAGTFVGHIGDSLEALFNDCDNHLQAAKASFSSLKTSTPSDGVSAASSSAWGPEGEDAMKSVQTAILSTLRGPISSLQTAKQIRGELDRLREQMSGLFERVTQSFNDRLSVIATGTATSLKREPLDDVTNPRKRGRIDENEEAANHHSQEKRSVSPSLSATLNHARSVTDTVASKGPRESV